MSDYVTVEVPFVTFGNRRGFTRKQLVESAVARDFYARFQHCFTTDLLRDIVIFEEPRGDNSL